MIRNSAHLKAMDDTAESIEVYKLYNVHEYTDSDGHPLGISIRGKVKPFIDAHEALKNKIKKGFQCEMKDINMRVLDVRVKPAVRDAVVEVSKNKIKGQAEIKIYRPSVKKNKGASIELRKSSGFDYEHLVLLKDIVSNILDDNIDNLPENDSQSQVFKCNECNWESKFKSALKAHKARLHKNKQALISKRKKGSSSKCSSLNSSLASPPRKKDCQNKDIENMDISVEQLPNETFESFKANIKHEFLEIMKGLETRICQLESSNAVLKQAIDGLKTNKLIDTENDILEPPKHLSKVKDEHISQLKGFVWRYIAEGNGACANNCVAVALHEDEDEAPKVKRRTLDHIAEHFVDYYLDKIGLPYVETVGTGVNSKTVRIETAEEMINFLKSEEALVVFFKLP